MWKTKQLVITIMEESHVSVHNTNSLSKTRQGWTNTLEHDVDYHNTTRNSSTIWKLDKKPILNSVNNNDPWKRNTATIFGLLGKNTKELIFKCITGSSDVVYQITINNGAKVDWFTKKLSRNDELQ